MFGIGMPEMLLLLAIALIVIGPKKLPDLAKSLGRAMREFKKATSELKDSFDLDEDMSEVKNAFSDLKKDTTDLIAPTSSRTRAPATEGTEETEKLSENQTDGGSTPQDVSTPVPPGGTHSDEAGPAPRENGGESASGEKLDDLKKAFDDYNAGGETADGPGPDESETGPVKPKESADDA